MISVELEGRAEAPLCNVGLVVWQSAFVLADYLVAHPPFGTWHNVSAIDLGAGTGTQIEPKYLNPYAYVCGASSCGKLQPQQLTSHSHIHYI